MSFTQPGPKADIFKPAIGVQPRRIYAYCLAICLGGDGLGAAGESANVTHAFQSSGRFALEVMATFLQCINYP
jgi:hypothetical protein